MDLMSGDLLEPDVPPPGERTIEDEDRRDDVAEPEAQEAVERDDDVRGIEGEEHLGLTPPG
jgi:hypothetical protein